MTYEHVKNTMKIKYEKIEQKCYRKSNEICDKWTCSVIEKSESKQCKLNTISQFFLACSAHSDI